MWDTENYAFVITHTPNEHRVRSHTLGSEQMKSNWRGMIQGDQKLMLPPG